MRDIVADLHSHSLASDGDRTPSELVFACRDLGLQAVALTDHDTIAGLDEAAEAGHRAGVHVIPGVEVSLRFRRAWFVGSIHLLLYFHDVLLKDPLFGQRMQDVLGQGRGAALVKERVKAINSEFGPRGRTPMLDRPLTEEVVSSYGTNISRRHFAKALEEIHGIGDRGQITAIVGNDSPAYVPSGVDISLLPPLMGRFPFVRVLAHPAAGSFPGPSHYKEVLPPLPVVERLIPELLELGMDGLEVHYPGHTPEQRELLLSWADQWDLAIVTGGSDSHDRTERPLGVDGVTQEELEALVAHLQPPRRS